MPMPRKRDEDRIRRNKDVVQNDHVYVEGPAPTCPDLGIADIHPLAQDWYYSLAQSAQCRFYEMSDWNVARLTAKMMSDLLASPKPSSELFKAIMTSFNDLLTTEGARRKVHMEIQRTHAKAKSEAATLAEEAMIAYSEMMNREKNAASDVVAEL